jgi:gluconolactonase
MDRRTLLAATLALAVQPASGRARAERPPRLRPQDFSPVVTGLQDAEGIAVAPDGRLFLSDARSALAVLERNGELRHIGEPIAPAGVAVDPQGRVIVANVGLLKNRPGPLQRVDPQKGSVETLVSELEGRMLVATNCPTVARDGTIYCTHSSWGPAANIGTTNPAGFVFSVAPNGTAGIVARALRGANGCCLDRKQRNLYVVLTAEGRICRFRRQADGSLGPREDYGPILGKVVPDQTATQIRALSVQDRATLGYCDGIAFDRRDNLWITLPFSNRLVALTSTGRLIDIVHDPEGRRISMPTNLAWNATSDLFVACRGAGTIVRAHVPV